MHYVCPKVRFLFYDGTTRYTVELSYGLKMWFVFEDEKDTQALYSRDMAKKELGTKEFAESVLHEYLSGSL